MVKPATLGRVHGNGGLGTAGGLPQRLVRAAALQIPQRGVDRSKRKARDRAHRRCVRVEEKIFPQAFDLSRVAPDQARAQMIAQQRDDRRPAGPDRVRVADALRAVAAGDAHDRRFLLDERLDGVGAHDFRWQVDLQDFDALDQVRSRNHH